jgi:hypothetical protein
LVCVCVCLCVCVRARTRLFCICIVLCVGSGLATDWSLVQGDLLSVKNDTELTKRPGPRMGFKSHWEKKSFNLHWPTSN